MTFHRKQSQQRSYATSSNFFGSADSRAVGSQLTDQRLPTHSARLWVFPTTGTATGTAGVPACQLTLNPTIAPSGGRHE
jgi:hypothetical protein